MAAMVTFRKDSVRRLRAGARADAALDWWPRLAPVRRHAGTSQCLVQCVGGDRLCLHRVVGMAARRSRHGTRIVLSACPVRSLAVPSRGAVRAGAATLAAAAGCVA